MCGSANPDCGCSHDAKLQALADEMSSSHPGFKAIQRKIEAEGNSKQAAGAILASASRNASPSAKKANPHLNRVGAIQRRLKNIGR